MADNDMGHMNFIDRVTAEDCSVLRTKETTYQGSWKRAGGRSAWFMMRRNMDRLVTMLAPPARPENFEVTLSKIPAFTDKQYEFLLRSFTSEDIFAKIEEHPNGEDGTVLACVRDLRRYLTLIEAEMVSRGAVPAPTTEYVRPTTDVYQMIADEKGLTRDYVKGRIHALFYGANPVKNVTVTLEIRRDLPEHSQQYTFPNCPSVTMSSNPGRLDITLETGTHDKGTMPFEDSPISERRVPRYGNGGSQHATLVPWQVDAEYIAKIRERIGDQTDLYWQQSTPRIFRLYPVVESHNIPKELSNCYDLTGHGVWSIRLQSVPEELRDCYPRLQQEMNSFEFETSPQEYRFMYQLKNEKWTLGTLFSDWAREA